MEIEITRGDTMINPRFKTPEGKLRAFDIVVANPMWNQDLAPDSIVDDPFDRFRTAGGIVTGKGRGDWPWLQHTLGCLTEHGRAAVVLDTGALTRGSGSKNEDRERNISKWFVDHDLIDGVILLPDNLFYNTNAAGVIIVLNKRKQPAREGKIVLVNASHHFLKGRPKNYIPEEASRRLAATFLAGEQVGGEIAVITTEDARKADYNLSPSRWVGRSESAQVGEIATLMSELIRLDQEAHLLVGALSELLLPLYGDQPNSAPLNFSTAVAE
jgi:type I restriction enzyme M protein